MAHLTHLNDFPVVISITKDSPETGRCIWWHSPPWLTKKKKKKQSQSMLYAQLIDAVFRSRYANFIFSLRNAFIHKSHPLSRFYFFLFIFVVYFICFVDCQHQSQFTLYYMVVGWMARFFHNGVYKFNRYTLYMMRSLFDKFNNK